MPTTDKVHQLLQMFKSQVHEKAIKSMRKAPLLSLLECAILLLYKAVVLVIKIPKSFPIQMELFQSNHDLKGLLVTLAFKQEQVFLFFSFLIFILFYQEDVNLRSQKLELEDHLPQLKFCVSFKFFKCLCMTLILNFQEVSKQASPFLIIRS